MLIKNIVVTFIFGAVTCFAAPAVQETDPPCGTQPDVAREEDTSLGRWAIYQQTTYGIEGAGSELALSYNCPDIETCIERAEAAWGQDCKGIAWVDYSPDPGV